MAKYKKILLFIITGILVLITENAYAANLSINGGAICDNGLFYNVEGQIDAAEFYQKNKTTTTGFGLNPDGNKHNFSSATSNFSYQKIDNPTGCYYVIEGEANNFKYDYYACNQKYADQQLTIDNQGTIESQIFDKNTNTITIKLTASGKLAEQFDKLTIDTRYNGTVGKITKDSNNKKIIISGISPSKGSLETLHIYVYLANPTASDFYNNSINAINNCAKDGKLYISSVQTVINFSNFFKVKTGTEFTNSNNCKKIREFTYADEEFKRNYVPECYNDNLTVTYAEYLKMPETIKNKLEMIIKMFQIIDTNDFIDTKDLKCTNSNLGLKSVDVDGRSVGTGKMFERKLTYSSSGTYWGARCYEEYYVQADDPQLVRAGEGVEYDNRVEIRRYCDIFRNRMAVKPPQCVENCWFGVDGHGDGGFQYQGGPNSSFDSCINTCDGGKYTQECINTCYDKTYDESRKVLSKVKNNRNNSLKFTPNRLASDGNTIENMLEQQGLYDWNFDNTSVNVVTDDNGSSYSNAKMWFNGTYNISTEHTNMTVTIEEHHDIVYYDTPLLFKKEDGTIIYKENGYFDWTKNGGGKIITYVNHTTGETVRYYESMSCAGIGNMVRICNVGPDGCSWNPDEEYQRELAASRNEYSNYYSLFTDSKELSKINDYTITFEDTETNRKYSVSGSNSTEKTGVVLDINRADDLTTIANGNVNSVQIGDQGDSITVPLNFYSQVVYDVKLPTQYTLKNDANTIIVKGTDGYYKKVPSGTDSYRFEKISIANEKLLSNGEHVYYTSLNSNDTNRMMICDKVTDTSVTNPGTTDPNKLISQIAKNYDLKSQIPANATRTQLLTYWQDASRISYLSDYSINAYVAYINKDNLIVKSLRNEKDNINVSFEIGTLGSTPFEKSGFDCYYGVYNMLKNTEKNECETQGGLRYYYHEINPEKIFDNREPRWNWTGTITGNKVTGAAANIKGYIVDPERLIAVIEAKGNTIYTNEGVQNQEMDYEYTLTNKIIQDIRAYNKTKVRIDSKTQKIPYTQFTLAVANNSRGENFSEKVAEWLGGSFKSKEIAISECNNSISGSCYNYNLGGK